MNPLLTEMEHKGLDLLLHGLHLGAFAHAGDVRTLTNDYSALLQHAECVQRRIDVEWPEAEYVSK